MEMSGSGVVDLVKFVNKIQLYVTSLALEEDGFDFDLLNDFKITNPKAFAVANNHSWQMALQGDTNRPSDIFKQEEVDLGLLIT